MQAKSQDHVGRALQTQMKIHQNPGLYIVSMDHSPSEQLIGNGTDWHTTVLVLSPGVEHAALAHRLASRLRPKVSALMKWVNATRSYRKTFLKVFLEELVEFSAVSVFAISAREDAITDSLNHFVEELKLQNIYKRMEDGRITFGPCVRASTGDQVMVILSENRAKMCLFVAHFVLRMRQKMFEAANEATPDSLSHINWNFFGDKFPGTLNDDMDLMFQMLMALDYDRGQISWGYFKEGGKVDIDLLVDNLAGALNHFAKSSATLAPMPNLNQPIGLFYWEQWE